MAKVRYDSGQDSILRDFVWEGTPEELLLIYDGLKQRLGNTLVVHQTTSPVLPRRLLVSRSHTISGDMEELTQKMPTVDQLIAYILGKPKFEHDIVDIGMKFFGKQIKARRYGKLYRELRTRLENARKSIESSQRGAFEPRPAPNRNLRIYSFKQVNATLWNPATS